jgi:hypothetical protein
MPFPPKKPPFTPPRWNFQRIQDVSTWVAPAVVVPLVRYTQDPEEDRNQLFVRDFGTLSVGAGVYLGTRYKLMPALLNRLNAFPKNPAARRFWSYLPAHLLAIAHGGIVAVQFSHWYSEHVLNKHKHSHTSEPSPLWGINNPTVCGRSTAPAPEVQNSSSTTKGPLVARQTRQGKTNYELLEKVGQWTLAPLLVPALRYLQDPPDKRNEYYVRDFTTLGFGSVVFFGVEALASVLLKQSGRLKPHAECRQFLSYVVGHSAQLFNACVIAIYLSRFQQDAKARAAAKENGAQSPQPSTPTPAKVSLRALA